MKKDNVLNTIEKKKILSEIKDISEKEGIVSIYVNAFGNIDSDNDISEPGSFDKTIVENFKRIKHLKDHDRTICLGLPLEFKPDNYGLLVRSKMNLKKDIVMDVFNDYIFMAENNNTLEHSIGYRTIKCWFDNPEDMWNSTRHITEYKLLEYSTLQFLGANEKTPCVGIKSNDINSLQDELILLNKMLFGRYTNDKLLQIESTISIINDKIKSLISLNNVDEPLKNTQNNKKPSNENNSIEKEKVLNIINNLKLK